jgi:hypothetical protein
MGRHYDPRRKEFKIRKQKTGLVIRRSLKQLSEYFGVELTNERNARPYWNKYLEQQKQKVLVAKSVNLQQKLQKLQAAFMRFASIPCFNPATIMVDLIDE